MGCETCIKDAEISALKEEVRELKSGREKTDNSVRQIEILVTKIDGKLDLITFKIEQQNLSIDNITKDTNELKSKPGKFFDKAISAAITTTIGSIAGALIALVVKR